MKVYGLPSRQGPSRRREPYQPGGPGHDPRAVQKPSVPEAEVTIAFSAFNNSSARH